ncbi:MAG: fused response regulator/phosphatase [Melioribacteraceae bacterium]|nr:fused response regulator/phosphatase [Melioribacteraceae bacterium]MCO6473318.1 fused response regulator/phosphatase [Melioribacteraceae bacterium]MDD3557754.1 fused response regulator/phosphatase [Melioribacteraceae bacterium]
MEENKRYKVLLVEDEENIATLFKYNLKKSGFECEVACNGIEGLDKVAKFNPDIIISDIMMPEMDGLEFRKILIENPNFNQIPFVFLTAKGEEEDILGGYELDIEDYIIKTSSPKVVLAKLTAILKSKQKEREKTVGEVQQAADDLGAKVVPEEFLKINGFDVKHFHRSFDNIPGGDFIDYMALNEDTGVVVLGDVMGKKWKAWYFAVAYAGYVRSAVRFALKSETTVSPAEILAKVNESVHNDERIAEVFITLSVLVLDNKNKTVTYAGAGDLPILLKSNEVKLIESHGLLLGFDANAKYKDNLVKLNSGEEIILFTDGLIESRNPSGELYGNERLIDAASRAEKSDDLLEFIKSDFNSFTNNVYEDDFSLISIKAV